MPPSPNGGNPYSHAALVVMTVTLTALKEIPLLAPLNEADLAELEGYSTWSWYQPGEAIVRQGQAAGDFCIVVRGQVEVLLEGETPTRLSMLGSGEFFGELSALTGEAAPATVLAKELTTVLRLSHEGLMQLLERNSALNRRIIATLAARVKEAGVRLHRTRMRELSLSKHITAQVERTHPEWVGTGPWSQRVRAAIARGSKGVEPVLFVGEAGTGKELAAARLHYNSVRKDGPLIIVDGSTWSGHHWEESLRMAAHGSILLRQADQAPPEAAPLVGRILPRQAGGARGQLPSRVPRILATAGPAEEREPSAVESAILSEGFAVPIPPLRERREDIPALVRHFMRKYGHRAGLATGVQPIGAEALRKLETYPYFKGNVRELERVMQQAVVLAAGGVILPEHLRLGSLAERGRPKIGLALGGGSVRGACHIGVLRALEEEGIPVDCIAGTSAGAMVGALVAGGLSWRTMEEIVARMRWLDVADFTWPGAGFLKSRKMRGFIERYIGPVTFDDLRIPFAAVAADANTGQEVILRQGRVADAVRGSTAIPGVFKPVVVDGRLLVDGACVNNVPAGVCRAMGADLVIAVDVSEYSFTTGAPRSIVESLMRAYDIMAHQTVSASLEWADVVITPSIAGLNGYKTQTAPEFVRRGYAAACEALPAVRARLDEYQHGAS